MAWTAPRTWVTGEVVTAALMNTHVRDDLRYLKGLDGDVTIEANIVTAFNVDGVDVSAHKAGTAQAQHDGGAGNHTHQSSGAQGNTLDHGAALTGKGDDDHTQYALRTILTTRGDIVYRNATVWARLAKGNAGEFLKQGANDPEWAQGVATREVFFPITGINNAGTLGAVGDFIINTLTAGNYCYFNFKAPHDFVSLTECKILGISDGTGTIDWTATTDFAAIGEAYNTNSDSDTANGLAMNDTEIEEVDISAAFTGLAADDYVGVKFLVDAVDTLASYRVTGLVFKYT